MKNIGRILWGLALIALGVILGGNALGLFNIDLFFDGWWTLFIIVPCTINLFTDKEKLGSLIGIMIGVFLLLGSQDVISYGDLWKLILPIISILIGLSIIFKDIFSHKLHKEIKELNSKNDTKKEHCAAFSGQNIKCDDEFNGVDLSAIFGGIKYDLTKAKIKEKQVVNCLAIFGGIEIDVPEDVKIEVFSSSAFGGVSDKRKKITDGKKTIIINASCIFGGVEIK